MTPNNNERRLLIGAENIAGYLGKPARWLYRQLMYRHFPPPVRQGGGRGSALMAYQHELDEWLRLRQPTRAPA
jgi:predicted DNA-binding transcriptional regulator AlpA